MDASRHERVHGAIEGLYAAASGELAWAAALARMADTFGFPAAVMQIFDHDARPLTRVWHNFDDTTQDEYTAHYRNIDPLLRMITHEPQYRVLYTGLHTPREAVAPRSIDATQAAGSCGCADAPANAAMCCSPRRSTRGTGCLRGWRRRRAS
jgi:hypothetical protein